MADLSNDWRGRSVGCALKLDLHWYLPDGILTVTTRLSAWHSLELALWKKHCFKGDALPLTIRGSR